jgi:hypothetical protein
MGAEVAFVVPSTIYFLEAPLSYTATRSVYSPEERAAQTAAGILSIREHVPGAHIVMVETGLRADLPDGLEKAADTYVYAGGNAAIRRIVDGPHKGHGEAVSLLVADAALRATGATFFFKLSGRYRLDGRFNLWWWRKWVQRAGCIVAKKYNERVVCTRLYGFHASFYRKWRRGILDGIGPLRNGEAIERVMPMVFPEIRHLVPLGVSGMIAPYGVGANE